jgi:hypothetical protein
MNTSANACWACCSFFLQGQTLKPELWANAKPLVRNSYDPWKSFLKAAAQWKKGANELGGPIYNQKKLMDMLYVSART